MKKRYIVAITVLCLMMVGCGSGTESSSSSAMATPEVTAEATETPTETPTPDPTEEPTTEPTPKPTEATAPTETPTPEPTEEPSSTEEAYHYEDADQIYGIQQGNVMVYIPGEWKYIEFDSGLSLFPRGDESIIISVIVMDDKKMDSDDMNSVLLMGAADAAMMGTSDGAGPKSEKIDLEDGSFVYQAMHGDDTYLYLAQASFIGDSILSIGAKCVWDGLNEKDIADIVTMYSYAKEA